MEEKKPAVDVNRRRVGFTGYCGFDFTEVLPDRVVISCTLRPELLNPGGIAHGGLIATLTDVAAGCMALQADDGEHEIVTQNCNIHYLRPGIGPVLRAKARVIRKGHRVCVVQVDCLNEDGSCAATAIYEIAYLSPI